MFQKVSHNRNNKNERKWENDLPVILSVPNLTADSQCFFSIVSLQKSKLNHGDSTNSHFFVRGFLRPNCLKEYKGNDIRLDITIVLQ